MSDGEQLVKRRARERRAGGVRLGSIFGVEVTIEWSFLIIFSLITLALASVFGRAHPAWPAAGRLALAVAAALLFVASVVGHELAHALVARRFGIPVHELRLFLLGGVSDLEREPPSPRAELLVALAGPLVSFVIGAVCLTVASFLVAPAVSHDPVSTVLLWLGRINVLLGTFNLIPGFPLDGGRVLRAALWRVTGDLPKATRWASSVGQATGWTFVILGVAIVFGARVPFFGAGAVSGLWLALIGMFLTTVARRSYDVVLIEQLLEGVKVRRLMRSEGDLIEALAPVSAAADSFLRSREHVFPVTANDGFVGLLSVSDLARAPREAWDTTTVAQVMTPFAALVTATPDEDVTSALRKMGQLQVEQLPVVEDGRLVGVLESTAAERWIEMHKTSAPPPRATRQCPVKGTGRAA